MPILPMGHFTLLLCLGLTLNLSILAARHITYGFYYHLHIGCTQFAILSTIMIAIDLNRKTLEMPA